MVMTSDKIFRVLKKKRPYTDVRPLDNIIIGYINTYTIPEAR